MKTMKHSNYGTYKYSCILLIVGNIILVSSRGSVNPLLDSQSKGDTSMQIVPDLRDGLVAQSIHTDVYSLDRILNILGKCIIEEDALLTLIKQTLND